jgi:hypothetical protein
LAHSDLIKLKIDDQFAWGRFPPCEMRPRTEGLAGDVFAFEPIMGANRILFWKNIYAARLSQQLLYPIRQDSRNISSHRKHWYVPAGKEIVQREKGRTAKVREQTLGSRLEWDPLRS